MQKVSWDSIPTINIVFVYWLRVFRVRNQVKKVVGASSLKNDNRTQKYMEKAFFELLNKSTIRFGPSNHLIIHWFHFLLLENSFS